ncbi:YdcF family protein [Clostridium lacusfryxellense]|uniref:YdcF family protein n=1 Tax=Clostridium lacusfryxellense TaxID=205328 RepID=UPI001C0E572C|nr:ElyC/SanA/YdcF family protein [Clostridium lacusfryxellense]MBU3113645.1 YdcF family protein [Clostridium lacusfryxellense]
MSHLIDVEIVNDINNIITFLAKRDINELSKIELARKFGITQVDMVIILGNSIPFIAELGAKAYKSNLAKDIMIVGGIGHSTKYLIQNVLQDDNYKDIDVYDKSEADILRQIIVLKENIEPDKIIIESKSTNCGSNASEALKILKDKGQIPKSIILIQDPTMQLRSHASFFKDWEEEKTLIISYSPFIPKVKATGSGYEFINDEIRGLWDKSRFIDLIMGEIPRLRDDKNGYGPIGKGFITHVDMPQEVLTSYERLLSYYTEYKEIKNRI